MTLQQIELDVYRRLGFGTATPNSDVQTRIRAFINRWYRRILSGPGMQPVRRVGITFSSIASQPTYGVALKSIQYMTEQTTNRRIFERTLDWYRTAFPDTARFSSTPGYYVPLGLTRIHTKPVGPLALFVKSSAAGDVGTAYVEVIRTNGYRASLSVAMTGTTAAAFSASITDIVDVTDFYLSAAAVGLVTLTTVSGAGAEISRVLIGGTTARFLRLALVPTPSGVIPYTVDGIADLPDLAVLTEEPLIPIDFHDLLADGAIYDEWVSKGRDSEARVLRGEIEGRLRQLRAAVYEHSETLDERRPRSMDETMHLPIL